MFFLEYFVDFSFLLVDDAIDGPRIYIFFIFEEMQYLENTGWGWFYFFELDDCLLSIDPMQHGEVLLGDLDQGVSPAMEQE